MSALANDARGVLSRRCYGLSFALLLMILWAGGCGFFCVSGSLV